MNKSQQSEKGLVMYKDSACYSARKVVYSDKIIIKINYYDIINTFLHRSCGIDVDPGTSRRLQCSGSEDKRCGGKLRVSGTCW